MGSILLGRKEAARRLSEAGKFLRSREGLEIAGEHVLNRTALGFRRGIDPVSGTPWKRLRPNTIAGRRRGSSKPLNNIGLLRGSFIVGGRSNIHKFKGSDSLTVGSSRQEAVWHNFGTKGPYTIRKKRKKSLRFAVAGKTTAKRKGGGYWMFADEVTHPGLPARRMLGINRAQAIRIEKLMKKHVDKKLGG